jgi:two-component system response regulator HydG
LRRPSVLVIDDNVELAGTLAGYLSQHGFAAESATGGRAGIEAFYASPTDVVLVDLRMPEVDGLDVLDAIKRGDPSTHVVIMTAFGAIESAVEAIRRGAYHYIPKPFKLEVVRLLIERACEERALRSENQRLRDAIEERFGELVGGSPAMRDIYALIEQLAPVTTPALIVGETGTGKELVARAIHAHGPRAAHPFVAINCAAVPEALLESELFGHARGAFTGATQPRKGLFGEADGGTLLLDEIGDMPFSLQAKLLRVLESREVRPVGSDSVRSYDVRILAATHRKLEELVREGKFREDLYYRLRVVMLKLPPLRERREDLPALIDHFLVQVRRRIPTTRLERLSPEAIAALGAHAFPGNVRELAHLIESLAVTATQPIAGDQDLRTLLAPPFDEPPAERARRKLVTLRELENDYIAYVLDSVGGSKIKAAEILGVDPSTLHRRERAKGDS